MSVRDLISLPTFFPSLSFPFPSSAIWNLKFSRRITEPERWINKERLFIKTTGREKNKVVVETHQEAGLHRRLRPLPPRSPGGKRPLSRAVSAAQWPRGTGRSGRCAGPLVSPGDSSAPPSERRSPERERWWGLPPRSCVCVCGEIIQTFPEQETCC